MFSIPLSSMNDQERHDYILKTFVLNKTISRAASRQKRDIDVIKEHHRFLWDNDVADTTPDSWEARLARRYYDKLFKEYCIADLTRHKENKVALRWRTEQEVVAGKGQFQCGSRKCEQSETLRSWEVNFAYQEQHARKNALVKLRLCPEHSDQLNYTSRKREVKRLKRSERQSLKKSSLVEQRRTQCIEEINRTSKTEDTSNSGREVNNAATPTTSEETAEKTNVQEEEETDTAVEDVWSKKPEVEAEPTSRETDFERYLEDLLL